MKKILLSLLRLFSRISASSAIALLSAILPFRSFSASADSGLTVSPVANPVSIPHTGDSSDALLWFILMIVAGAALAVFGIKADKEER